MKTIDVGALSEVPGLVRCEEFDREALGEQITELTHTVYAHEQVYGQFCTVHAHIDCPPQQVFEYMANPYSLLEWTYSVRDLRPMGRGDDVFVGVDSGDTPIYCKTVSHPEALTVDYHCAWDQGDELWMIYLNRIVPAQAVLGRSGSVVIWTNCHHPHYDKNPFPELDRPKRAWVGEWWPLFYAGHSIELANLKAILEHRHRRGLGVGPYFIDQEVE
jgi:hypothetical protein